MNKQLRDSMENLSNLFEDLLSESSELPAREQQELLAKVFDMIVEKSARMKTEYWDEVNRLGNTVTDLEHLIVFSKNAESQGKSVSDIMDLSSLPQELRGKTSEEYLRMLGDILTDRRNKKDWSAIYRVIENKVSTIRNFILNMENRKYNLRDQNEGELDFEEENSSEKEETVSVQRPRYLGNARRGYTNQVQRMGSMDEQTPKLSVRNNGYGGNNIVRNDRLLSNPTQTE